MVWSQAPVNGFSFDEITDVPVIKNGNTLSNPWAGGLNFPQINTMDLDNDGLEDLLIYESNGQRIIPFLNTGTAGNPLYSYAPEYRHSFPKGDSFYLLRDFNCDGKKDIFTSSQGKFIVYENTTSGALPSFTRAHSSTYLEGYKAGTNNIVTIAIQGGDIPGIVDVDNDGDLDIITFLTLDNTVSWIENKQNCGLQFDYNHACWGHFSEDGFSSDITLNSCVPHKYKGEATQHSGSAVLPLDLDGDGVKDLLVSDVSTPNVIALFNSGTADSAYMSSKDVNFPNYDQAIDMDLFPGMFYEDIDGDQVRDLITVPNAYKNSTGFVSSSNIWVYKNKGTDSDPDFERSETNFLRNTQIDIGEGCVPRIVDLNTDGLNDIVLANGYYRPNTNSQEQRFVYLQNTGTVQNPEFTVMDTNFANISSYGLGLNLIPTFGDLDQDNDMDMIVGDSDGKLHYFTNTGTLQDPSFTLTTAGISNIDVGKDASPFLIDVNEDGDLDLVIGNTRGTLSYYENQSPTSPSFNLVNSFFGGVNVTELSNGYSIPYLFRYNGVLNMMVSGELGVYQFDSISSISSIPSSSEVTIGNGNLESADANETPFGTTNKSGRNRMLILASELKAAGLSAGKITHLSMNVTRLAPGGVSYTIQHFNLSLQNVSYNNITNFDTPMQNVVYDNQFTLSPGWNEIQLKRYDDYFEWDGHSNLLIEICFRGNWTGSKWPVVHVEMSSTSHASNAYGDITNYNVMDSNGCEMPMLQTINKRPNIKLKVTPTFDRTSIVMADGYRNAAAFGDLNQDGFIDALLGNYAGGVTFYKGRQYVIGQPEKEVITDGFEIYPNPGQGNFTVATQGIGKASLSVFDLTGRLVARQEISGAETPVKLENEPNGIYLFILQEDSMVKTQKVVLQR
tara:strand:- start:5017 stop:7716 length:2700 start_codon:yes stop_codon:yes gene_type:complete